MMTLMTTTMAYVDGWSLHNKKSSGKLWMTKVFVADLCDDRVSL